MRKLFIVASFLFLVYMIWPGPSTISDFKALPDSDKSDLAGDTWQIPNVSAYFSNNYRDFVIPYYKNIYWQKTFFPFPPMRLNYPPEFSWNVIKKHTDSTYLEELVYPLRDSLYVNGFEPFYADGNPKFWGATKFNASNHSWDTKVTMRYYPTSLWVRILVWFGIVLSFNYLYKLGRKIVTE